jgi:hypothetical protein
MSVVFVPTTFNMPPWWYGTWCDAKWDDPPIDGCERVAVGFGQQVQNSVQVDYGVVED